MNKHFESLVDVTEIGVDAAKELYKDAKQWIGSIVAKADEWMSNYGD